MQYALRILVGIPKGRDIPEFDEALENTLFNFDKFISYYRPSWQAFNIIRSTFLNSPEYTHLVILHDDLIVTPKSIGILLDHLNREDYAVICGCCNVDMTKDNKDKLAISLKVVSPYNVKGSNFYFPTYDFMVEGSEIHKKLLNSPQPITIKHMGNPFPIMKRDVIEKLSFHNDAVVNGMIPSLGCCEDVVMSYELDRLGIPIYCDLHAMMQHMKISDQNTQSNLQVGKKEPYSRFVRATN